MTVTAATLITTIRDLIPDATYDAGGNALADADGQIIRAQTLYRFLTDGLRATALKTGWVMDDWSPMGTIAHVPHYDLDERWQTINEVWFKGWRLGYADEGYLVWPQTVESAQSVVYGTHQNVTNWNVRIFPAPNQTDPTATLSGGINAGATTLTVSSALTFLPFGYVQIDNELIQYYAVNYGTNVLSGLVRGTCGTAAATHSTSATVSHKSIWVKGDRLPSAIVDSTTVIEMPLSYHYPVQLYALARVRQSENEFAEAANLMNQFNQECQQRLLDPKTKQHQGLQAKAYGDASWGPLAWGRVVVP